jgi:hypothetical protein
MPIVTLQSLRLETRIFRLETRLFRLETRYSMHSYTRRLYVCGPIDFAWTHISARDRIRNLEQAVVRYPSVTDSQRMRKRMLDRWRRPWMSKCVVEHIGDNFWSILIETRTGNKCFLIPDWIKNWKIGIWNLLLRHTNQFFGESWTDAYCFKSVSLMVPCSLLKRLSMEGSLHKWWLLSHMFEEN